MNRISGITKYYVGFGILMLLMIGCLVYVLSQAGSAKTDKQTNATVEQIANKLELNISEKGEIPATLEATGIKNVPSTVNYSKLSSTQYKVCIDYKTATSGFDAGWGSLLLGGAFSSNPQNNQTSDRTYFDSSVEFNHKKGQNCQTVTPYGVGTNYYGNLYGSNPSGQLSKVTCSDSGSAVYIGYLTVKSVNTTLNNITFTSGDATTSPSSSSFNTTTTKVYDTGTVFCDTNSQPTTAAALKTGNYVTVYQKSDTDTTLARIDIIQ